MLGSVRLVICMHTSYKFPQKFPMLPFNRNLVLFASFCQDGSVVIYDGDFWWFESRADYWGKLEKPSLVGSSHGYQHFMRCRFSSATGGFGLLEPSDRAVICSAKPHRSYLLIDFIKRYINKLILYYNTIIIILYNQFRNNCITLVHFRGYSQYSGLKRV